MIPHSRGLGRGRPRRDGDGYERSMDGVSRRTMGPDGARAGHDGKAEAGRRHDPVSGHDPARHGRAAHDAHGTDRDVAHLQDGRALPHGFGRGDARRHRVRGRAARLGHPLRAWRSGPGPGDGRSRLPRFHRGSRQPRGLCDVRLHGIGHPRRGGSAARLQGDDALGGSAARSRSPSAWCGTATASPAAG